MEHSGTARKRKAVTKDVDSDAVAVALGEDLDIAQLDATLSDTDVSEAESAEIDAAFSDDESSASLSIGSEEVPDDGEMESGVLRKRSGRGQSFVDIEVSTLDQQVAGAIAPQDEDEEQPNYRVVTGADGRDRYIYEEIDPDDDSEYSVGDEEQNTIGNIPLSFYDSYPHIGYNINGKKILRPARGEALDALLDTIEVPKGWTGLTDPSTGRALELSQEELQLLRKVQMNEIPADGYDPYEPTVEWFTSQTETMPLSAAPEPKRRFIPSKHEANRVMKIVRAIRDGRILPYKPPVDPADEDEGIQSYDIWANEESRPDHAMHMPAPKLPPPRFDESYHPPPEYLPDKAEKEAWEQADEEDKDKDYLPKDHDSLRKVAGYDRFVKEKFERCLDLYLAPRVRRSKLNIDPESLLPKLPSPDELRPFPSQQAATFVGHHGRVRSLAVDPSGRYLATGGDDGTARVWSLLPARQVWSSDFGSETPVNAVRWRPSLDSFVLVIAVGDSVHLAIPTVPDLTPSLESTSRTILDAGFSPDNSKTKSTGVTWTRSSSVLQKSDIFVTIPLEHTPKVLSFHTGGNHFLTVCPASTVSASQHVSIHTLSTHRTQQPFAKRPRGGGPPQSAHFHPSRPILYVANQRVIRAYDLSKQTLLKIIQPGARWISDFSVHPTSSATAGSDNLLVSSYDRRLLWMDLDLSPRPYRTLRYHDKAIRTVRFHPNTNRFPLFADGSDDGSIQVFHGLVTADAMSNARIVPLKVLKGHKVANGGLGVMEIDWHPTEAWLLSAGGDGVVRMWT